MKTPLVDVNCGVVVGVDETRGDDGSQCLREGVNRQDGPWVHGWAQETVCECYGWVEVRAGAGGGVDSEEDS